MWILLFYNKMQRSRIRNVLNQCEDFVKEVGGWGKSMKNWYKKEKGITLVEIIVSIALLTIVLTIFASFLTQSSLFTKKNEEGIIAVNLARLVLDELKQYPQSFPDGEVVYETFNIEGKPNITAVNEDGTFKQSNQHKLRLTVTPVVETDTFQVKVEVISNDGETVTETYGLIEVSP